MTRAEEDRLKLEAARRFQEPTVPPHRRRKPGQRPARGTVDYSKGYECIALSVDSSQAKEYQDLTKQHGLSGIEFDERGICTIKSRKHRKEFLKILQMHDRDGGYGD
jgi:hypothetical protein